MTVQKHYDTLLGDIYTWMLGDFDVNTSKQMNFFMKQHIRPGTTHLAFDLGAGNGIQSIALARLGFKVTAVDFTPQLLEVLKEKKDGLQIETIFQNFLEFLKEDHGRPELIVCMGDTLTHVPNRSQLEEMISNIAEKLHVGGKAIFSYRDLSDEKRGLDRFFQVRADDERSLTCFLEYFEDYVMVYDILIDKKRGKWTKTVSGYPKLRVASAYLKGILDENGLHVCYEERLEGMTYIIAEKVTQS